MERGTKVWEHDLEWTHLALIEPTIRSAAVETHNLLEFVKKKKVQFTGNWDMD